VDHVSNCPAAREVIGGFESGTIVHQLISSVLLKNFNNQYQVEYPDGAIFSPVKLL